MNAFLLGDGRIVRKVKWDALWHVIYQVKEAGERVRVTYDRISCRQARRLRKQFNADPCYCAFYK